MQIALTYNSALVSDVWCNDLIYGYIFSKYHSSLVSTIISRSLFLRWAQL